jgi:hypothetical protein
MRWQCVACMAVVLFGLGVAPVLGSSMNVDELLYQDDTLYPAELTGTVDMLWQDDKLLVTLTNTSGNTGSKGAMNLLTGLGFTLPDGIDVSGGSVSMLGATAVNFTAPGDGDVSSEWAYNNSVTGGHFFTVAHSKVDTILSTLKADAKTQFSTGPLDSGTDHGGVDFGLIMQPPSGMSTDDFIGSNPEAIQDSISFVLNLSGTVPGNLVELIDAESVVLQFGSPGVNSNPEPSTVALLCMGAFGCLLHTRRKRR